MPESCFEKFCMGPILHGEFHYNSKRRNRQQIINWERVGSKQLMVLIHENGFALNVPLRKRS